MNARNSFFVLSILLGFMLGSCATPPVMYTPDASLSGATAATLYGSRDPNLVPLVADARTFVTAVDGRPTGRGPHTWDEPLLVAAGLHTIQIAVNQRPMTGTVGTQLTLEAGKSYVVQGQTSDLGKKGSVWIEEKGTDRIVGEKMVMCLENTSGPLVQLITSCK